MNSAIYKLYGVLVHIGYSTHSGHYYAYTKGFDSIWRNYDDDSVYIDKRREYLKQKPYILFYIRSDARPQQEIRASKPVQFTQESLSIQT